MDGVPHLLTAAANLAGSRIVWRARVPAARSVGRGARGGGHRRGQRPSRSRAVRRFLWRLLRWWVGGCPWVCGCVGVWTMVCGWWAGLRCVGGGRAPWPGGGCFGPRVLRELRGGGAAGPFEKRRKWRAGFGGCCIGYKGWGPCVRGGSQGAAIVRSSGCCEVKCRGVL